MTNELQLRIAFAGTPEFAATCLLRLLDTRHSVCAVFTQPDRPAGRGRKLRSSPVKHLATHNDLPVFQPVKFGDVEIKQLEALELDLLVVAAYGLLLPEGVLRAPRFGCINVHASLLPRWRGAAPIQRAILAGDTHTGITIMQMDAGLDTGDMLEKRVCEIATDDTAATLHDRLAELGATALTGVIDKLGRHALEPQRQNEAQATYARRLHKREAEIDWTQCAHDIDKQVRAFNPWPVAFTGLGAQRLRVWAGVVIPTACHSTPGRIVAATSAGVDVATGEGLLRLTRIQLPGGRQISAADWSNAHSDLVDTQLGTPARADGKTQ